MINSRKTLGDYFTLQRGTTYKSGLLGQPGPLLLGLATIQRNGGFRSDSLRTYGGHSPDHLLVQPGDLYVSLKDVTQSADLLGAVAKLPSRLPQGRLTQDTVKLIPRVDDFPSDYIYWLLRTPQSRAYCRAYATGTTNLGLARKDFLAFPVPEFNATRCRIVDMLEAMDDKIELNRQLNETLEAMARALFKSWFVDFDPVRAKMEGRDTGLPQEIADLFPDRLIDSEIGDIPEEWTVGSLGDIATVKRKAVDPGRVARDMPYIGLQHMPRQSIALTDWGKAASVSSGKSAFEVGDILFGKLRPYFHKVGIAPVDGLCSTDIVVLSERRPNWFAFVLACVSSSTFVAHTSQTSIGTKMPRTSWQAMSTYELCRPTDAVAGAFRDIVSPMLRRLMQNIHESRTLAALRDALLPNLISGQIRVPDDERILETVA